MREGGHKAGGDYRRKVGQEKEIEGEQQVLFSLDLVILSPTVAVATYQ